MTLLALRAGRKGSGKALCASSIEHRVIKKWHSNSMPYAQCQVPTLEDRYHEKTRLD